MIRLAFREKSVAETQTLTFDFLSLLALGESISSASTSAAVYSGTDSTPAALISGATTIAGSKVTQKVVGGVAGVMYTITCTATTSAGQVLAQSGYLVVR